MKALLERLLREPALTLAVVTEGCAFLVAFGVDLSDRQTAAVLGLVGALVALLRFVVTPTAEVIATKRRGHPIRATAQAEARLGLPDGSVVDVRPLLEEPPS